MILLKLSKIGAISYVSHIDTMRVLLRTLSRSGLNIKYSEGFNPHPLVNMSHPLTLACQSKCEYAFINNLNMSAAELADKFNMYAPDGIEVIYALDVSANPNTAGKVKYAEYSVIGNFDKAIGYINSIMENDEYIIEYERRNEYRKDNVRNMIRRIECDNDTLRMTLATGSPTLRPDLIVGDINKRFGLSVPTKNICREKQFVEENGALTDMDDYVLRFRV